MVEIAPAMQFGHVDHKSKTWSGQHVLGKMWHRDTSFIDYVVT
jgi:hypothetical protein